MPALVLQIVFIRKVKSPQISLHRVLNLLYKLYNFHDRTEDGEIIRKEDYVDFDFMSSWVFH